MVIHPMNLTAFAISKNRISLSLLAIAVLLGLSVVTVILSETDPLGLPMQIVYADPGISAYASK